MGGKIDGAVQFYQAALRLREMRQEVLASNIANADTPNYKARDMDFARSLQAALQGSGGNLAPAITAPGHLAGSRSGTAVNADLLYRRPVQPSADGNTVDMDVERAQFADNALRYEASVKFVSEEIKRILMAIQG